MEVDIHGGDLFTKVMKKEAAVLLTEKIYLFCWTRKKCLSRLEKSGYIRCPYPNYTALPSPPTPPPLVTNFLLIQ